MESATRIAHGGRIEFHWNGAWGTIFNFFGVSFTKHDAALFCSEVYNAEFSVDEVTPLPTHLVPNGKAEQPIFLVNCNEKTKFTDCNYVVYSDHASALLHQFDVGVLCGIPFVAQTSNNAVMVKQGGGNMMNVCHSGVDENAAMVLCRSISDSTVEFGSVVISEASTAKNSQPFVQLNSCTGQEANLVQCDFDDNASTCKDNKYLQISCMEDIKARVGLKWRAEVYAYGEWGRICDDGFNINSAVVFCNSLNDNFDYDADHVEIISLTDVDPAFVFIDDIHCYGTESNIGYCERNRFGVHNCNNEEDVAVFCKPELVTKIVDQVALVEYNGEWGTICEDNFDIDDAVAFCNSLGNGVTYTKAGVRVVPFSEIQTGHSYPMIMNELGCKGNELNIGSCMHAGFGHVGSCSKPVGVVCEEASVKVRISDGGRAELFYNGEWGTIYAGSGGIVAFGKDEGTAFCNSISDTTYKAHEIHIMPPETVPNGSNDMNIYSIKCDENQTMAQCQILVFSSKSNPNTHHHDAGIICGVKWEAKLDNYGLALVRPTKNSEWGTICMDGFGDNDALTFCRSLDDKKEYISAAVVVGSDLKAAHSGPIYFSELDCTGLEANIGQCPHLNKESHSCTHTSDVSVACVSALPARIGDNWRAEIYALNEWGTLCEFGIDINTAVVFCNSLVDGYTYTTNDVEILSVPPEEETSIPIIMDNIKCQGNEKTLLECTRSVVGSHNCFSNKAARIKCKPDFNVRLVDGYRAEVKYNGQWGTICSSSFDITDAIVFCRSLNKGIQFTEENVKIISAEHTNDGTSLPLLSGLECMGNEANIGKCKQNAFYYTECDNRYDIGIQCDPKCFRYIGNGYCKSDVCNAIDVECSCSKEHPCTLQECKRMCEEATECSGIEFQRINQSSIGSCQIILGQIAKVRPKRHAECYSYGDCVAK